MKYLVLSDIHGSSVTLEQALSYFEKFQCDRILLLGDVLYHGPRNPIPEGYNPSEVVRMLNERKAIITAVRGNCEAEVDQMLLDFSCFDDFAWISLGEKSAFLTHGHLYNPDKLPSLKEGTVFMYGHTHLFQAEKIGSITFFNPGSITLPKGGNPATFGILTHDSLSICALSNGEKLRSIDL